MYEINFKETRKIIMEKNNDNENQDKKRKVKKNRNLARCAKYINTF